MPTNGGVTSPFRSLLRHLAAALATGARVFGKLPNTQVLVTASTLLAAVAAGLSAYAAFKQEKATFTSNLYSKQVDELGEYFQISWRFHDDTRLLLDILEKKRPKFGEKPDVNDLRGAIVKESKDIYGHFSKIRVLIPGKYFGYMRKIENNARSLAIALSQLEIPTDLAASHLNESTSVSTMEDDLEEIRTWLLASEACMAVNLQQGKVLSASDSIDCKEAD